MARPTQPQRSPAVGTPPLPTARGPKRLGLVHFLWAAATFFAAATSAVRADDPENCLLCHQYRGLALHESDTDRVRMFFADPNYSIHRLGPHARLACTDCHPRDEVKTVPHGVVTPVDCARQCHLANPNGLERRFSHSNVLTMLEDSADNPQDLAKLRFDKGPMLRAGQSTCLYCHDEPLFRDAANVIPKFAGAADHLFDRCDTCHSQTVPVDTAYYFRHVASRLQPARSTMGMAQACAVCHSDPAVLKDHEMPDAVASFVRSFHGKAALLGDETTAQCLSCHVSAGDNAHRMLPPDNPASSVNAVHVADSCRSYECHPGAGPQIADAAVHLDLPTSAGTLEYALAATFIVLTIFTFGPSAVLVLLDLVSVIIGRKHHDEHKLMNLAKRILMDPRGRHQLKRFTMSQRIQHWVLAALFTVLVLTGFPLKFADQWWASMFIGWFGGIHWARVIHHWSGIFLVLGFLGHLGDVFIDFVKRARELGGQHGRADYKTAWVAMPMWISPDDVRKTFQLLGFLLFIRKDRPSFGRFSPAEKFEYLGVFWGTMLLGITGLLLWGEQVSSQFLTGRALNLATIAHTYEAFLAVIHVGILHIYNVIFAPKVFPLSTATLDGETPLAKLAEEHGDMIRQVAQGMGIGDEHETSYE